MSKSNRRERFGGALVLIGIVLELAGGIGAFVYSGKLETAHRRQIADMQAEFSWRSLNLDEQRAIAKSMNGFAGKIVRMTPMPSDPEARELARDIDAALGAASPPIFTIDEHNLTFIGFPPSTGVNVYCPDWEHDFLEKLVYALAQDGHLELVSSHEAKNVDRKEEDEFLAKESQQNKVPYEGAYCQIIVGSRPRPHLPASE